MLEHIDFEARYRTPGPLDMPGISKQAEHPQPVAGIVAEYNPFHLGHQWMVRQLRESGVHTVVCVMSGAFVQRAEAAMLPCHIRAKAALAGGVDLVLRLPVGWATASAEAFALGGVGLLSALGCVDLLAFGAECAEVERLTAVADLLFSDAFNTQLKTELSKGVSFATARSTAAEKLLPGAAAILQTPNNILAIEYIKALHGPLPAALYKLMPDPTARQSFKLPTPVALPRIGAAHDGVPDGGFASASWLRMDAQTRGVARLAGYVPPECLALYQHAAEEGDMLALDRYEAIMLGRLRGKTAADFARFPGAGEGLEARLAVAAKQATSLEQLYALAKSKRFAHSRVRRLALAAALGLPKTNPTIPPFAHVLAANGRGLALLRRAKQSALVPLSTSLAKLAKTGDAAAQAARLEDEAEDLHALCLKAPKPGGGAFTHPAALVTRHNG